METFHVVSKKVVTSTPNEVVGHKLRKCWAISTKSLWNSFLEKTKLGQANKLIRAKVSRVLNLNEADVDEKQYYKDE